MTHKIKHIGHVYVFFDEFIFIYVHESVCICECVYLKEVVMEPIPVILVQLFFLMVL